MESLKLGATRVASGIVIAGVTAAALPVVATIATIQTVVVGVTVLAGVAQVAGAAIRDGEVRGVGQIATEFRKIHNFISTSNSIQQDYDECDVPV